MNNTVRLYAHTIEYWWDEECNFPLSETDEEHIGKMLANNCNQGELCSINPENDEEIWGWWIIQR